jgi:tRNA G18 (ribose-2'-O)-methylase SpoU
MRELSLILHDIRSSENVGSIFRSADGAGATKIYLSGYTPAPLDRFGRENVKLAKSALGSEKSVTWEQVKDVRALIASLQNGGVRVVAVEQDPRSIPYDSFSDEGRVVLVLGNEVEGVPKEILDSADAIIEIPMHGKKESLNVAVAAGVVLYQLAGGN